MARRTTASTPPPEETPDEAPAASATTTATTEDEAAPEVTPGTPPVESRFFAWMRGLALPRRAGWLGGVCAGVADRLGIDPLIVRGIAVVLAVVGAPVALLYAIAWFLLPDEQGVIHAQQLGHGRVTRALPGILGVFLLSFLPLTQSFWYAGALYWNDLGWGGAFGRIAWTGVLLIGAIVVVVWLAKRSTSAVPVPRVAPETVPADAALASAAAPASAPVTDPGEPPAPPADVSDEELAAWRERQDAWQTQRAAWAAEQRRSERERRQAEASARAAEALAASRERTRIRTLTRPRASAGVVFLSLGVALVGGALAAFAASGDPATADSAWVIGAGVLVLVLGVATVAVGIARRRSGALAFFSILAVLALLVAVVLPSDRVVIPPGASMGISGAEDGRFAQLAGSTSLYVPDRDGDTATVDLWQLAGSVYLELQEGATVRLEIASDDGVRYVTVDELNYDGSGRTSQFRITDRAWKLTLGEGTPDLVLRLWAGRSTSVYVNSWSENASNLLFSIPPDETWSTTTDGSVIEGEPTPTATPMPGADTDSTETGGN
ncbi:PspC domain-containing protein [Protaetiibacter intestinalis]|uniref:PspC domain-containing protein n=1 Tax=Protaetiibacter intestinalis TaxID=2419774 RepID=A0A387B729_9MICO|nr:PspC domain-containing protein [Protaetiibacter intestinalis]AYF98153.1 PspC domain-containing protein [Protaetiibacter intestinalis]